MLSADTTKSDAIVNEVRQREPKLARKEYGFSGTWTAAPEDVFPLLCPAREADWIPGWTATVLHSTTGYAEDRCIFETDANCVSGPGLWTFTGFKENEYVRLVRFTGDTLIHAQIALTANGDGTTTGTWHMIVSALNQQGNANVARANGEYGTGLIKLIDAYLEKGHVTERDGFDAWGTPEKPTS